MGEKCVSPFGSKGGHCDGGQNIVVDHLWRFLSPLGFLCRVTYNS